MSVRDMFSLDGRVAIVTGGSRGLGLAMAACFAEAGAAVVVCARRPLWLASAAEALSAITANFLALQCDVTRPDEVGSLVEQTIARFGKIDILVNNAGVSWAATPEEMPLDRWRTVLDTNVTGAFLMSQAVGRRMLAQRSGRIINIASIAGLVGIDPAILSAPAYSASKGAIIALTKDLAVKWGPFGLRVNAIAPGFFPTRLSEVVIQRAEAQIVADIPLGRLGASEDVCGLALFLAAPASSYITGQVIALDGGATAH